MPGKRKVWQYGAAKWDQMKKRINSTDWIQIFEHCSVEQIVDVFTKFLLNLVHDFVPTTWVHSKGSSHPWLSQASKKIIAAKRNAEGTDDFGRLQQVCSEQVRDDYGKFIERMKKKVDGAATTPKQWWKLSSKLMLKDTSSVSIPPLQSEDGKWALTSQSKANLLASTFSKKFSLPGEIINEYSTIEPNSHFMQSGFLPIRLRSVLKILKNLELDSSSGPDLIATRILKRFAVDFAFPLAFLCRSI